MRPVDETGRRLVQKYVQHKFAKAARRDESQAVLDARLKRAQFYADVARAKST